MRRLNLETEYNNRERVQDHPAIQSRWQDASETFRTACGERLVADVSYGDNERQAYDLFLPEGDGADSAPVIVYFHGGYWQRGDRKDYSCVAEPLVAAGCRVAVASYRLCPDASVTETIEDAVAAVKAVYEKTGQKPLVIGHSAGGHLAVCLLATDWSQHEGVPDDLVSRALAISGVFTLRPLLRTSINDALNLDRDAADAASPALWPLPGDGRRLIAAVGARESREFIRQSLEIVGRWMEAGLTAECLVVPDANHFTVLDELMKPNSGLCVRAQELTRTPATS